MSLTSHPLLNSLKEMLGIIQIALNVLQTTSKRQGWAPSHRDAASTGPAVFKTNLLQKNGISAIFFSEMLYWVFFHIFDVVLALWHIPSLQINASTTF
ncbi:hypothetical protein [Shewanella xiamenensis]|uniref:Uncharacterized protein n=1 Tax=Shewanella xiamenensis TaxID=332186 RepID=A0AAE4TN05_9GAMM|nr:hypothetical protein [Shewanella xiamenensis]MDV5392782.1 hypothetical protein [Shewanella xiamenensis]BDQ67844.1 hypothetical protein NUITMVS2_36560 [Shewanella xiamenensis]GLD78696.1 hypothetical protein NUITMVS3_31280 [Shewanella xiamenensis]